MPEQMVLQSTTRLSREGRHQWRETTDGRILVFPRYKGRRPEFHGFFEFGEFEAAVWRLLETPQTAGQLCATLRDELTHAEDVELPDASAFWAEVSAFLSELAAEGLIEVDAVGT